MVNPSETTTDFAIPCWVFSVKKATTQGWVCGIEQKIRKIHCLYVVLLNDSLEIDQSSLLPSLLTCNTAILNPQTQG